MNTDPASNNRITVSEDKLDSKLARLELSLVDRITKALDVKADQAYVEQLHARVHTAEGSIQAVVLLAAALRSENDDTEKRIRGLERFRYAIPSASALAVVAAAVALALPYLH